MKVSGFWVVLFVLGTALLLFSFSKNESSSSIPDEFLARDNHGIAMMTVSRKLKENGHNPTTNEKHYVGEVNLDDYRPIDPVPRSKAAIRPGPIEHGSPLIPYIPKPSPPSNPKNGA